MKKLFIAASIAGLAVAAPAHAQSATGTVNVIGAVGSKCTALTPIAGTIDLAELALSDGTVDSAFSSNTSGLSLSFTIRCTSADANIKVSATPLANADATTGNGYTGTVHYKSTLVAGLAAGGTAQAVYTTADVLPAETVTPLNGRLANAANNLTISVSNGATTNATDLLKAGAYAGVVTITVAPI